MSFSENMIIEFARRCVSSDKKISLLTPGGFITGFIDTTVPYLNDECNTMSYIAFLEREPAYQKLIALADYFDVSLDYLVGRSDDPKRR